MFSGCLVALVTPFKRDGALDEPGLKRNVGFLLKNRVSGLVPCATTGEGPCLSDEEYDRVVRIAVRAGQGRVSVVPGAGTNSTRKTIALAQRAKRLGADGCLVVTPYYNRPTQEGLYAHFRSVAEAVAIPIIVYNVPGRTGVNILPGTVRRLAEDCENIVGIKEASGNLDQVSELIRICGADFRVLSGDDSLTLPMLALGAVGVISVIGNILPRETSEMVECYLNGREEKARAIHLKLFPLTKALFIETNPVPVKQAMNLMGLAAGAPRLPLVPMSKENVRVLSDELDRLHLAKGRKASAR